MNCQECRNLFDDMLDRRIKEPLKRRMQIHLTNCAECSSRLERRRKAHTALFRALNHFDGLEHLPDDFADRLVAECRRPQAWWQNVAVPKWVLIAASLVIMAGFAFAATVAVDALMAKDSDGEETVRRAVPNAPQATEVTDGSDALAAPSAMADAPYVTDVASVPSEENPSYADNQLKGENEMNIKHRAAAALAAATLAATSASSTELPWTAGETSLGGGKVTIAYDEDNKVTLITAKPTGGEELRITGSAMTFADGAKVSLASPASGEFADGRLVFANDVTAQGALTLNRTDGAFPIWSGNRLSGVSWVNAFAANGSQANDWSVHSAYAVPTSAGISENELPHGIYRPIPTHGMVCNRWSGKYTFSARFQLQNVSTGYLQVRMLTGVRTSAGLYLPNTDTWSTTKYRTSTASDAQWFWYNDTPVDGVTLQYGGDEYKFGICRIIFQRKNTNMGTIGFAGEATMAGTVSVGQGVRMSVMPKSDSTFAAPEFSGYGDVEYARNSTLSYTNRMVHSTITVTNATVTLNTLGAIPNYCTVVVDNGGLLDVSRASGSAAADVGFTYPTDIEVRTGGRIFSDRSAGATWKFGRKVPFKLLGGTLECNSNGGSVNYVYLNRLLMTDGAMLKCNKPFWVANDSDGYWTVGGTGATVNGPVEFLSASASAIRGAVVNVNDDATLVFANTLAYNSGFPHVDFIKKGGGTVVCQDKCHPTAIADGLKVQDGVWKLGVSDSWLNARPLTLDGGTIAGADNTANTVGELSIGADGGTIELCSGATLSFADSASKPWLGSLTIKGWRGYAVRFGNTSTALTCVQLDMIRAETPNGDKMHLCLDSAGYLVPRGLVIKIR